MKPQDCPSFGSCQAPLCPLDAQSIQHGIWFADEAICCKCHQSERWIAIQRRIAKRTQDRARGYFTVAMLDALGVAGRAITGLDPNVRDGGTSEKAWVGRKGRKPLSETARQDRRAMLV